MSRAALFIFTWAVAEFLLLGWIVSVVGLGAVVLASLVAAALGAMLVRRSLPGLVRDGVRQRAVPERAVVGLAGILLIIPGVLSGVVGALLVVPPIRAAVGSKLTARLAQFVPAGSWSFASNGSRSHPDVVDVDLVNEDITKARRGSGGAPELR